MSEMDDYLSENVVVRARVCLGGGQKLVFPYLWLLMLVKSLHEIPSAFDAFNVGCPSFRQLGRYHCRFAQNMVGSDRLISVRVKCKVEMAMCTKTLHV